MEIYELRYFLEVARFQNLHKASKTLHVSTGSLSKAIARLEDELRTQLFHREGRNIRLTEAGKALQERASRIVALEQTARLEIGGRHDEVCVVIAGQEVSLAGCGLALSQKLKRRLPCARFDFRAASDERALEWIQSGEVHLALVTNDVPVRPGWMTKIFAETKFQTYVGPGHALYADARAKRSVPVEKLLDHAFAVPDGPMLGKVQAKQSLDGWRDDQLPRRIEFSTSSLKLLESLVSEGHALAYLPDHFTMNTNLLPLRVSGCPYTCIQKIRLVGRNPKDLSWLSWLF